MSPLLTPTSQMRQLRLAERSRLTKDHLKQRWFSKDWSGRSIPFRLCYFSSCPFLTRAAFPALGVPFQPTPPAPTSSQFILSRILSRLPLASNLAHPPKLLDFKGRTVEILIVSMTARKCPFYLSSCNLGALGDHPWLPDDHPYGNTVSFTAPLPSTPFTRQL